MARPFHEALDVWLALQFLPALKNSGKGRVEPAVADIIQVQFTRNSSKLKRIRVTVPDEDDA